MKQDEHDERMDRMLSAMRTAEPARGMEERILARLSAAPERKPTRLGWWYGAGLAAVAALLLMVAVQHVMPLKAPATSALTTGGSAPASTSPMEASTSSVATSVSPAEAWGFSPTNKAGVKKGASAPGPSSGVPSTLHPVAANERKAASSGDKLASFPAPAEPLTEQEKLLLQVARRGDQKDFELLNPERVEIAMAADKAEFDRFVASAKRGSP